MIGQNILKFYGSKLDIKLDNSETYDFIIDKTGNVDLILDYSETCDFIIDKTGNVDLILDCSEEYDFQLDYSLDSETYELQSPIVIITEFGCNNTIITQNEFTLLTQNEECLQYQE